MSLSVNNNSPASFCGTADYHNNAGSSAGSSAGAQTRGGEDLFESIGDSVSTMKDTNVGTSISIDLSGLADKVNDKLKRLGPFGVFLGNVFKNSAQSIRGFGKLLRGDIGGGLKDIFKGGILGPLKNAFNLSGLVWMAKKVRVK